MATVKKGKVFTCREKSAVKTSLIEATEMDMKNGLIIKWQNVNANNL